MNAIVNVNPATTITMTSLEIVEFINMERQVVADSGGKKYVELLHKSFLTKVPQVLGEEASAIFFAQAPVVAGGGAVRMSPIYNLPKREASLMAMSYSYAIQAKVWDKMTQLEEEVNKKTTLTLPNFSNPAEAARAWAAQYEIGVQLSLEVEKKEALLIEQAPKVEYHDAVVEAVNCHTMEEAAKVLGWGRNNLFKWLRNNNILMGNNVPYQRHLNEGHFRVIERKWENAYSGEVHIKTKTLVTGKGMVYLQKKIYSA